MTAEEHVMTEVPAARQAYRADVPPSQIVNAVIARHGWQGIMLVLFGMRAFALSIPECKGAEGITRDGVDAVVFDAYFVPLIDAKRARWDR